MERSNMSWASRCLLVSITLSCIVELMQIPKVNALTPEEESSLENLQQTFSLPKWKADPCDGTVDWVICFADSFVSDLKLSGKNLSGLLPDLRNLTQLDSLELDRNNLTGGIPPSIFNHSSLTTLDLSYNPLGGSIPPVTGLTNLRKLVLTGTEITGALPDSLKNLANLIILELGDNPQLGGTADIMDQLLFNVQYVNGSNCSFSGRLPALQNPAGLQTLDLQMNDFDGDIPPILFQHDALQSMFLSNNPKLSGAIPQMNLMKEFTNFFAHDCNLSGPLPDGSFSKNLKLEYIGLWNNRLTSFPTDLQTLTNLQEIDVHNNSITGSLPNLPPSTSQTPTKSLTSLEFSSNHFNGEIPSSWYDLTYLREASLASNNLSGVIQKDIGSLTNLRLLNLSGNHFSGHLPRELGFLNHLETLDLRNNQFSGDIPTELASLETLKTLLLDNNGFTGIPVSLTNRTDITVTFSNNPGIRTISGTKKSGTSTGAVVGAVIGTLAIIGILIVAIIFYKRSKKKNHADQISKEDMPKSVQGFSLRQIKVMTENFKTSIGKGGFGSVYYGKLTDGREVAVKVKESDSEQGTGEFLNEVRLLSRLHHRNLVTLVGYCVEGRQQILIYDFMSQGTLHDHLYHNQVTSDISRDVSSSASVPSDPGLKKSSTRSDVASTRQPLSWKTRLSIAVDSARGLEYLHKDCSPPVIHRDVKSSNILLTKKLKARVGDLGISKQASGLDSEQRFNQGGVTTMIKGTYGYLDPEYYTRRRLTTKSDVYSFGMVLLELITAKKPQTRKFPDSDATNVIDWVRDAVNSGRVDSIVDPALQGGYEGDVMLSVARLALSCTVPSGLERPEMGDVARSLTLALQMEGGNPDSTSSSATQGLIPIPTEGQVPITLANASSFSSVSMPYTSWTTEAR